MICSGCKVRPALFRVDADAKPAGVNLPLTPSHQTEIPNLFDVNRHRRDRSGPEHPVSFVVRPVRHVGRDEIVTARHKLRSVGRDLSLKRCGTVVGQFESENF